MILENRTWFAKSIALGYKLHIFNFVENKAYREEVNKLM